MNQQKLVLKFSCQDRPGIVADVASFFSQRGFNIRESSQFEDDFSRHFFMRTEFDWVADGVIPGGTTLAETTPAGTTPVGTMPVGTMPDRVRPPPLEQLRRQFAQLADSYQMDWALVDKNYRLKVVIAVSSWGHCLNNLLNSWRLGSLPVDVVAVISNHREMESLVQWYQLPYHYLPVDSHNRQQQEAEIQRLLSHYQSDLLVLARYMQILSEGLCRSLVAKAINIHHSFLPGFKGAKPYHQAYERGVKLIGATAHYVTPDLDEGPIIEQAVERVNHNNTPAELIEKGRDIEAVVLQRAVRWHAEHRVLLNGAKTVVFSH